MIIRFYKYHEDILKLSDEQAMVFARSINDDFHEKVEKLTGRPWCPYPGILFIGVVMSIPENKIAQALIKERRKYISPDFNGKEPQEQKLIALAEEYHLSVRVRL